MIAAFMGMVYITARPQSMKARVSHAPADVAAAMRDTR
jgi:hypothetical protein